MPDNQNSSEARKRGPKRVGNTDPLSPLQAENYIPVPESGCWLWAGSWNARHGYGRTSGHDGYRQAHRLFYEFHVGPIPAGLVVCHKCDTPACVNPMHLFLGDHRVNAIDRERKGRGRHGPIRKRAIMESAHG